MRTGGTGAYCINPSCTTALMRKGKTMYVIKPKDYRGCRNCKHQIDYLLTCEWQERGGDGKVHLICPRWEKKGKIEDEMSDLR